MTLIPLMLLAAAQPVAAAERRYSVTDFDRVQVDGPFQVVVTTGGSSLARATGSPAALDRISIDVQGRTLRVRPNTSSWGGYPGEAVEPARVTLTTLTLQGAGINGSGTLTIDKTSGQSLNVTVAGSGKAAIGQAETDTLLITMMGSGSVTIGGAAKTMRAQVQGTASLDGSGLKASDAQLVADTAGDIKLAVSRAVTVQASGAGNINIAGAPSCTIKSRGIGEIRCGKGK